MSETNSTTRYAWTIVALLFPVALLNYLDRQMIASMKMSVMNDIPSIGSEANWGLMLGKFKFVYAICSPLGGYLADRFSRKYTICGSLFIWSLITWLTGQVTTYNELLIARTAMGISEACYIPAALAMIADYHSTTSRSRAVGIHQMGIYCGVILGGFAGYVADAPDFGWRFMFDFTGLAGVLYAIPLLWLLKDIPKSSRVEESAGEKGPWIAFLYNPNFLLLVVYFTLPAVAAWVIRDWMPAILQKEFNISQGKAGVSAALYWQASALVFALVGGWLADRWMKKTDRGRIFVSAIGMGMIIPAMFLVGKAPSMQSLSLAIFGLILFGIGWGFFDINNMPILSQIVRPEQRATGYGIMNFVSMMCGGVADWAFGEMTHRKVPLDVIFSAFSGLAVISVIVVLMIRPKALA
jgi:MFS transporter, Spinster family, sphingosine-1-phosphate transporter